jgi:hypothetical protein
MQQEGFGLIITMMGGQQQVSGRHLLRKCMITGMTCSGLQTFTPIYGDLYTEPSHRNTQLSASSIAEIGPINRGGLKAVIYMHGHQVSIIGELAIT